jgi:hypothetical protein
MRLKGCILMLDLGKRNRPAMCQRTEGGSGGTGPMAYIRRRIAEIVNRSRPP